MFCVRYVVQQYYELEKRSNGNARYHNFMFWGRNVKLCGLHFYFFFFFTFSISQGYANRQTARSGWCTDVESISGVSAYDERRRSRFLLNYIYKHLISVGDFRTLTKAWQDFFSRFTRHAFSGLCCVVLSYSSLCLNLWRGCFASLQ